MIIIIDAYNLFKQVAQSSLLTEAEIHHFTALLKRYAATTGHRLLVVFDGGPYQFISRTRLSGLELIYAGYKQSADDVIKDLIGEYAQMASLVVSSDREIRQTASAYSMEHISSLEFYKKVRERLQPVHKKSASVDEQLVKIATEAPADLDTLMEMYSTNVPLKQEVQSTRQRKEALAKNEKKKQALLKKL